MVILRASNYNRERYLVPLHTPHLDFTTTEAGSSPAPDRGEIQEDCVPLHEASAQKTPLIIKLFKLFKIYLSYLSWELQFGLIFNIRERLIYFESIVTDMKSIWSILCQMARCDSILITGTGRHTQKDGNRYFCLLYLTWENDEW